MKYIDADKLRAEIERQMKYYDEKEIKAWDDSEQGDEDALWYQGHRKMCAKLLSFLDTLEEPVTDCHDFDSLFDEFCDAHPDGMTLEECGRFFFSRGFSRGKMVATNDFDLALAQRYLTGYYDGKYEPVSEDLEEAAKKYADGPDCSWVGTTALEIAFKAGAEWQKAKMMEEAVDAMVTTNLANRPAIYLDQLEGFQYGDKVKIIIVKEDEQ